MSKLWLIDWLIDWWLIEQTEQSQPGKIPEIGTESTDKEVENQTKKLEIEENITYTTEI